MAWMIPCVRLRSIFPVLAVALFGSGLPPGSGAALAAATALPRVRSSHPYIRAMMAEAQVRSSTFQQLVHRLEATDGIVYVEEGECRHGVRACLVPLLASAGSFRILRVVIDARQRDWDVMASIAHELQHAYEALSEPSITDSVALHFFILMGSGHGLAGDAHETQAAVRVGDAVKKEVAAFARRDGSLGIGRREADAGTDDSAAPPR